jgi:hypothetical protein
MRWRLRAGKTRQDRHRVATSWAIRASADNRFLAVEGSMRKRLGHKTEITVRLPARKREAGYLRSHASGVRQMGQAQHRPLASRAQRAGSAPCRDYGTRTTNKGALTRSPLRYA